MTPRSANGRTVLKTLVTLVLFTLPSFGLVACQDGEVEDTQVCAFQCDYLQDGTTPGLPAEARLTEEDVLQIIVNAIVEAKANGVFDFTIVVNDHLNNVLAVFDSDAATIDYSRITSAEDPGSDFQTLHQVPDPMGPGANVNFAATSPARSLQTALDGIFIPAGYAAISKAGTANYFSTQGNAFSSRTAGVLIQQNFFPGETDRPGGPLFDVQIAQLACSDINTKQTPDPTDLVGPRRLPVGFAADPGGLPLYKDGIASVAGDATSRTGKVVVGSVGIEYNGIYSLDTDGTNRDANVEERIATAATRGFEADIQRQASRITVAGRALRFADDTELRGNFSGLTAPSAADVVSEAAELAFINAVNNAGPNGRVGTYRYDEFFFPFAPPFAGAATGARDGVFFLSPASGVIPFTFNSPASAETAQGEAVTDALGNPRFDPAVTTLTSVPAAPADPNNPAPPDGLSANDVNELLVKALLVAENTRAQTRRPLGGQARIDVAVVDVNGELLGFARSQDALLDGVDVTIAKTRTAAFWSKAAAQAQLRAADDPLFAAGLLNTKDFDEYVDETAAFLSVTSPPPTTADPPFNGDIAWSSAGLGGITGRDFPPGVASGPNGPLARNPDETTGTTPSAPTNFGEWSIFSTGIQTEVVLPGIALALCEEVPDLANVLSQLPGAPAIGAGPLFDPDSSAGRRGFCRALRTALLGTPDPLLQPDCLQGVQDQNGAPVIDSPGLTDQIVGLQNGFHIFQGAVPIYRLDSAGNSVLVGGYGVSGDGAEQDDFVPFVALDEVFKQQIARGLANPIGNAPRNIRADNVSVANVNLRYVVCPVAPFLSSNEQNGCEGR